MMSKEPKNEISNGAVAAILLMIWAVVVAIPFAVIMLKWWKAEKLKNGSTIVPDTERAVTFEGEEKKPKESFVTAEHENGDGQLRTDFSAKKNTLDEEED